MNSVFRKSLTEDQKNSTSVRAVSTAHRQVSLVRKIIGSLARGFIGQGFRRPENMAWAAMCHWVGLSVTPGVAASS